MKFAGRLARLWRRAALIPPRDPLAALDGAAMARARRVLEAVAPAPPPDPRTRLIRGDDWTPPPRPPVSAEDAAWFEREIRPLLPAYAAFCAAVERWQRHLRPPRGIARLACISPAFAGRPPAEIRLPPGLAAAVARA